MRGKIKALIPLVSLLFALAATGAEERPNLSEAKKEGKVALYISTQLPLAQAISKAFEKKFLMPRPRTLSIRITPDRRGDPYRLRAFASWPRS